MLVSEINNKMILELSKDEFEIVRRVLGSVSAREALNVFNNPRYYNGKEWSRTAIEFQKIYFQLEMM